MAKKAAAVPEVVQVNERTFVMRADRVPGFLHAVAAGRETGATTLQDVGSLTDLNPNDPRDTGYAGILPNSRGRVPVAKLFQVYREDGTFARVVDQIAEDTWGEGWTPATKNEAWQKAALAIDTRLNIRSELELTDKWHLVGGVALLYLYLDAANADPWREPKGVADVFRVKATPRTRIQNALIEDDPKEERFDRVRAYVLTKGNGGRSTTHWLRVLELRQYPHPDSEWEGISLGSRIHDDTRMKRNVEWAAVTAYGQRSAPLLVVTVKEGVRVEQSDVDAMDEELKLLRSQAIQHVIGDKFTIQALTGTAQLPDPMPWWLMSIRSLSVTTGIPAHLIAGMSVGELASSLEDTRRWNARISRRCENYGTPIVRSWYERLALWGLLPPLPDDLEIQWASHDEPTAKEAMDIEEARSRGLGNYRRIGVLPPASLVDYTPAPMPMSPEGPLQVASPFGAPDAGGFAAAQGREAMARCCSGEADAEIPEGKRIVVAGVRRVEQTMEAGLQQALLRFFEAWKPRLLGFVHAKALPSGAAGVEATDKPSAQLQVELGKALQDAVAAAYAEAARMGIRDATQQARGDMNADAIKLLLDRRGPVIFAKASRLQGIETARRITTMVREVVAEGIAKGEDASLISNRIQARWTDLAEYEAQRIARTEAMTAYNQGHMDAMQALDIEEFEFIAYPGADYGDPDGPCVVRDGERFRVGDQENTPPLHPNDRCTMRPIIPGAP